MLIDDIALTMQPGIGPKTAAYLLSHFGTAEAIFNSGPQELVSRAELNPEIAGRLTRKEFHRQAEAEMRYCEKNGIHAIASTDPRYPPLLRECGDYPHVLYFCGDTEVLTGRMLSVVGTRRMTSYGQNVCARLIEELSRMFPDLVIVSGLAYGVDAAAHRAALNCGIRTVAVLPNQLPDVYPSAHMSLAAEIARNQGGLLTEYNSRNKDKGVNFVPRNRIIAGMSAGTIIIESPQRSGSLITAGMAEGYHRSVMAVPGRITDSCSEGTNYLISSNRAVMVRSATDVANELGWVPAQVAGTPKAAESLLSGEAKTVLQFIKEGEQITIDDIAHSAGLSVAELAPLLFELEFEGVVRMLPGKIYEKA